MPIKIYTGHSVSTGTLKSWIAKNPVGAMIVADSSFNSYTGGTSTYTCTTNSPSDSQLNKAVTAVGYDSSSNWIVRNSNGTSWGNGGYVTFTKGSECGLRTRIFRFNSGVQAGVAAVLILVSLVAF